MTMLNVPNCGALGVNKDLSVHELPLGAWTDALNIRFLDGYAYQFLGHGEVYPSPPAVPQFIMPVLVAGEPYWLIATANGQYVVANMAGVPVYTDISHVTPRAGVPNQWTGFVFGGIPVLNTGDTSTVPMYWDQNLANNFVDLPAWPASTYCRSLRSYKSFMIALGVTKGSTSYPYMVKWSSPAEPGALPPSWDHTDPTQDAGENDLAEGQDIIIDGMQLRDSFIIYKRSSVWRMDYVGGPFVFNFQRVLGISGALNRNCIVEVDGVHIVLTSQDVIAHDGQSPQSVLDKATRRYLFNNIDPDARDKCFLFRNPFLNEVFICYPEVGMTTCTRAVVWNYRDRTVSFREIPNLNHAAVGQSQADIGDSWDVDLDPWDSDTTLWNSPGFTPDDARVLMASADQKIYLLDATNSFNGTVPTAYLERQGLSFDAPEQTKLVRGIRPRITGTAGKTVMISVAGMDDPYETPVYSETQSYTIGSTVACDFLVDGRYIAIKVEAGTALSWRLDSFTIDIEPSGAWSS